MASFKLFGIEISPEKKEKDVVEEVSRMEEKQMMKLDVLHATCKNRLKGIKKRLWNHEEDNALLEHVRRFGPKNWNSLQSKGIINRTGKQCQIRWVTKLHPDLRKGTFSEFEKQLIFDLQKGFGNKWKKIATFLPGRSYYDIKNIWYRNRKKMIRDQKDEVKSPDEKISKNMDFSKEDVEYITKYCDMLLKDELTITKVDDLVEKKQDKNIDAYKDGDGCDIVEKKQKVCVPVDDTLHEKVKEIE